MRNKRLKSYILAIWRPAVITLFILLGVFYLLFVVTTQIALATDEETPPTGFEETADKLIFRLSLKDIEGELATDNGKVIWQYAGPENTGDLQKHCNSLNWQDHLTARARSIEAELEPTQGSASQAKVEFTLPKTATKGMRYCLRIVTIDSNQIESHQYHLYTLSLAQTAEHGNFIFRTSMPLEGTDIPSSLVVGINSEQITEIQSMKWSYVVVQTTNDCPPADQQTEFMPLVVAADETDPKLSLSTQMSEQVLCFKLVGLDGEAQPVEYYDTYTVPLALEETSNNNARTWLIAGAIIFVLGVVILFIARSKTA